MCDTLILCVFLCVFLYVFLSVFLCIIAFNNETILLFYFTKSKTVIIDRYTGEKGSWIAKIRRAYSLLVY